MTRWLLPLGATLVAVSCRRAEPPPHFEPAAPPTSTASIPLSQVTGKLGGKPFTVAAARYWVDRRPRYQKVDIELLPIVPDKPCEDVTLKHPTTLWLRHKGSDQVQPEVVRFGPGLEPSWEGHFEFYEGRNWSGHGDAAALLSLGKPDFDLKLEGDLSACFGDANKSCVAGHFVAIYCPIRIDGLLRGTEAMERALPGGLPTLPSPSSSAPSWPAASGSASGSASAPEAPSASAPAAHH